MKPSFDEFTHDMIDGRQLSRERLSLASLICFHAVICCLSLVYVSHFYSDFHVFYDPARLAGAVVVTIAAVLISCLFIFADFSFGYFVGFYLNTMILGYLWLNYFSDLNYDHRLGGVSAAASVVAFLAPALLISTPTRSYALSTAAFERLLTLILPLAATIIAVAATYGFKFVSLANIYDFRGNLEFPLLLDYAITITSSALLPFAFACFVMRRNYWQAGLTLALLLLIYPIALSKVAFFAPWWLLFIALLSRIFEARTTVIFSLLLPVLFGLILVAFFEPHGLSYFRLVNFRMVAVPSNAMDVYNDFFANHDLTYFCQIRFLKPVIHCPYRDPLSVVMERAYGFGSFNASLFATEGIASVGPLLAPISAVVCGLVAALGNRVSAGLPPRLIVISSGILPLVFLNVPMTTTLLTHGAAILFLLWYVTPRAMFEYNADGRTGGAVR